MYIFGVHISINFIERINIYCTAWLENVWFERAQLDSLFLWEIYGKSNETASRGRTPTASCDL